MMKAVVLANGTAGRGHNRRRLALVHRLCTEAGVELVQTYSPQETLEKARAAAGAGCERVIVAGGDGTAHYALNGIAGSNAALGIIPLGSGNDMARNLGLPFGVEAATRLAFSGPIRQVDLARVAGAYFASIASFGLGSDANRIANRHYRLRGTLIYIYALLRSLWEFRETTMRIRGDGGEFDGPAMLLAAGNGATVGGGMRITPRAQIDDGQIDLCVVRHMSKLKLLRCFPEVFFGTHLRHREVEYLRGSRFHIESDQPLEIFADGEPVGFTPTDVEVFPGALRVVSSA